MDTTYKNNNAIEKTRLPIEGEPNTLLITNKQPAEASVTAGYFIRIYTFKPPPQAEKNIMGDYSLYMARAGLHSASRALSIYKEDGTFGSGVVVAHEGEKYVLTNLHVIGYAEKATIVFKLHEKTPYV